LQTWIFLKAFFSVANKDWSFSMLNFVSWTKSNLASSCFCVVCFSYFDFTSSKKFKTIFKNSLFLLTFMLSMDFKSSFSPGVRISPTFSSIAWDTFTLSKSLSL